MLTKLRPLLRIRLVAKHRSMLPRKGAPGQSLGARYASRGIRRTKKIAERANAKKSTRHYDVDSWPGSLGRLNLALNVKVQWVKYTAREFRNKQNFVNAIYFQCGGLNPTPSPTKNPKERKTQVIYDISRATAEADSCCQSLHLEGYHKGHHRPDSRKSPTKTAHSRSRPAQIENNRHRRTTGHSI
jgi:hypothetical protein